MKRFNTFISVTDAGLVTSTVITGRVSIASLENGVDFSVGIALSGTSLLFLLKQ